MNQNRAAAPAADRQAPERIAAQNSARALPGSGRRANRVAQHPPPKSQGNVQRVVRQQAEAQNAVRQAVASGRSLSSTERANAPADTKAAVSAKETTVRGRREEEFLNYIAQRSDKGRTGGRSGR